MRDVLAWRCKLGVIGPSTNTVVEPEFAAMRPPGVTHHYSRIFTPDARIDDQSFEAGVAVISGNVGEAVNSVMTCRPDHLVMAMSAISFSGGVAGAERFVRSIEDTTGVRVSVGSHAIAAALKRLGGIKRIAVLTPYWPVMNAIVKRYFDEAGFEVVRDLALECPSWTAIAKVTPQRCRNALRTLDGDDIDALVQVGTNLPMAKLAAVAELWLGKPVIAVNTATYWHALRSNGLEDRREGLGRLLAQC
jgi:maleate isomerase